MSWFLRINLVAILLCFGVVVFGAFVRLSDAGLGCPDWPGCYGHLTVPDAAHEMTAAERNFPARPVEAHKAWKEMIHRYLASALGLLIVALAVFNRFIQHEQMPRRLPWALVGLVIFQGLLGMWTVTWQLKPLAVSAHLLGGMSTLALLAWMWLRVRDLKPEVADEPLRQMRSERHIHFALEQQVDTEAAPILKPPFGLRAFAALGLVVLAAQIFLGGWTSSNYAALACPDFPTCHGVWAPETDVKEAFTLWRGLGVNYEFGVLDNRARVTIHFFHRIGAAVVTIVMLGLVALLLLRNERVWKRLGQFLFAALVLQVLLGITIVKLQLPLFLADMHNAGAALLLLVMVTLNYFAWHPRSDH